MMWKLTIFAVVIGSIATTTNALPKLPSSLSSIVHHSHKQSSKPSFVSQKQIDNAVITDVVGDDLDEEDEEKILLDDFDDGSELSEVVVSRGGAAKAKKGGAASSELLERLKVGTYFGVWYALNVIYNSK